MRNDGERNPEIYQITDHANVDKQEKALKYLTLAYYFTRDELYAKKASEYLHTWFLDTTTRMNPNLEFAKAIKGVNDGRGKSLIETIEFSTILNVVGLLDGSKYWTKQDKDNSKAWFSYYLTWVLSSKNGKVEHFA